MKTNANEGCLNEKRNHTKMQILEIIVWCTRGEVEYLRNEK